MRFLRQVECAEWCQKRRLPLPAELSRKKSSNRFATEEFSIPNDAGRRVSLCRLLWSVATGPAPATRLVWIDEFGVWPSGEHMPLFHRLRASLGETRNLFDVPGHLCEEGDEDDGLSVLSVSALFLWDCYVYSENEVIVALSHDEYGTIYEATANPETRAALTKYGVLRG